MGLFTDLALALPPLRQIIWPSSGAGGLLSWLGFPGLPGERDYAALVGDGSNNNLVESAVRWMGRSFVLAPMALRQFENDEDDLGTLTKRAAIVEHFRWPTRPFDPRDKSRGPYSGVVLKKALMASYVSDGNAYGLHKRSAADEIIQTWYCPHTWLEPLGLPGRPDSYIAGYALSVPGQPVYAVETRDVLHIRDGIDPLNPRKGASGIKKLLRELYTDEKAARFTAAFLHNFGVPGIVISPEGQGTISKEQASEAKAAYMEKFGDDRNGEPLVMRGATKVDQFGFSPQQLDLSSLRDVPEERVSSVTGIPAAVLQLGTGAQQVRVGATLEALIDMGWQNAQIPAQIAIAEEITGQMLHEFGGKPRDQVEFDLADVPVMAKYHLDRAELWTGLAKGSVAKRSEARRRLGLPVTAADDVYITQAGVTLSESGDTSGGSGGGRSAEPAPVPGAEDAPGDPGDLEDQAGARLSAREVKVAHAVTLGRTDKAIAADLGVSERTVQRDVASCMVKLGASSRAELARKVPAFA